MKPYIRYQEQPLHKRIYIWLKYIPYAFVRGVWWYIRYYPSESFSFCIGVSIGDIQATKMHWVYSAEEVMQYLNKKKSSR